ncbi:MAG: PDDEXK nuclease domain-containing protein [Candidatus Acidiferrales bacterium]
MGRRIIEHEQRGQRRAQYGKALLRRLAADLASRFGKGFSERNLLAMREFFLAWSIPQTAPAKSGELTRPSLFPLPWSLYVRLLSVNKPQARSFYETEALRGGWSVRQLDRQIATQFFERTQLSRNMAAPIRRGQQPDPAEKMTPEQEIKDPFVLEFLDFKDEYSENALEEALIHRLEEFLLELGSDFAFLARQRRLRVADEWYRIDLLFFHRRLRCLVIIDLKIGKFTHADAGQMNLYLNYAREHWTLPDENPPLGLILCSEKNEAVAHCALGNLQNKVLSSQYKLALPGEKELAEEIAKTRKALSRQAPKTT